MLGRPLELDGAPEVVSPEFDPADVVEVEEPPEPATEEVVDEPAPPEIGPEEVVEVALTVVGVAAPDDDVVVVDGAVVVVEEVVLVVPADTPGLPDPCTATPTTPATRTAVIRPPRAKRGATGADLPSQATPNF